MPNQQKLYCQDSFKNEVAHVLPCCYFWKMTTTGGVEVSIVVGANPLGMAREALKGTTKRWWLRSRCCLPQRTRVAGWLGGWLSTMSRRVFVNLIGHLGQLGDKRLTLASTLPLTPSPKCKTSAERLARLHLVQGGFMKSCTSTIGRYRARAATGPPRLRRETLPHLFKGLASIMSSSSA